MAEKVCRRCKNAIGLLSLLGYNRQTGRCRTCERAVAQVLERFRQGFLYYCQDGILTDTEWEALQHGVVKESVDWSEALAFVRGDALHFLERTLACAASDGSITEAEASYVRQLRTALAIPYALAQPVLDRLTYLERLTAIRRGVLPHVQTDVQMESDEVCHLETQTTYHKVNAKTTTLVPGRFVATNKKLRFLSPVGGTEIAWKSVMSIDAQLFGIYLELSKKAGNGFYAVADSLLTKAVFMTLVRMGKHQLLAPQEERVSRHIPQEIKLVVWQRDRGQCVQCGAASYLEYDHIIPHTKGGANTVGNVQLLCRKCNLQKGDRI